MLVGERNLICSCALSILSRKPVVCAAFCAQLPTGTGGSFFLMARRQSLGHLGKHAKITASLPVEFSGFLEEELHPKLLILTLYICCAGT